VGGLDPARSAETKWNHPHISPSFWALMRISAWNRPDAWRLVSIPPCLRYALGTDAQPADIPWLRAGASGGESSATRPF